MKIDPDTAKKIAEALASGEATEGRPAAIPMPSADLLKPKPRRTTGSMREAEFQRQVIEYARLRGWRCAHFRAARVLRGGKETYETPVAADGKGFPDLLLVRNKTVVVAELKVPPNKTTPEQRAWIGAFLLADVEACIWTPDDWPAIEEVLR